VKFEERITDDDGLLCVDLTDAEANLYARSGDAIAYVDAKGRIERFVYIHDISMENIVDIVTDALQHGNTWHGWCSLPQFCDPKRLDQTSQFNRMFQIIFTRAAAQTTI
jgi:hypothetical protein